MSEFVPTDEQRAVIEHAADASMLVIAGAGSGKTESIARRIEYLVDHGADPSEILALTFTNKAAAELAKRVRGRLGADTDVLVSTYHGFAASLVEQHLLELDLPPRTRLINRGQAWQLCLSEFDSYFFEERSSFFPAAVITDALALAARIDDFLVDIAAVQADCNATLKSNAKRQHIHKTARSRIELCQVVDRYTVAKKRLGLLDFGDQIRLAVELVQTHPEIAAGVAAQRKFALLDEYQDTNYAQRVLLTSIYQHGGVVSAVGDDMQSIYAFRGADVRNIVEFADHFAPTQLRSLTLNRRSGTNIVAFANRIQGLVDGALDKTLTAPADRAGTDAIECFLAASEVEEATQIATDVDAAVRTGRTSWSECAVLCRTRSLIAPITAALERRKIPVEVVGIGGLLERPEIVDLLAWLELLADRSRNVPLVRLLRGPAMRIGDRDIAALARHARGLIDETIVAGDRAPMVLADAVRDRVNVDGLSHHAVLRLDELCQTWDDLCAAAERVPLAELCDEIARRTDLWAVCDDTARENLLRFADLAQRYAPIEGASGIGEFVEYIAMVMESEEELGEATPGNVDAVKVMTVHQAKGLEFDEVWVPGLANKKFPSPSRGGDNPESSAAALPWWVREDTEGLPHWSQVSSGDAMKDIVRKRNLDGERRLFYVACTRARRRLVLSAAQWYSGPATPQGPSEFYEFAAAQADLVVERYRHEATDRDPKVVAMEANQRDALAAVVPPPALPAKRGRKAPAGPVELPMTLFDVAAAPVATPPPPPLGLSVSSLIAFARCPRQFHWSAVRPLPRRVDGGRRRNDRASLDRNAPRSAGRAARHRSRRVAGDRRRVPAVVRGSAYAATAPAAVEAPFELLIGGHVIRGRVDAVYAHGERDVELVDFKTGRPPADGDPSSRTQLLVYAVAAVDAWGHKPDSLRASFVYLHRDGSPATAVDVPLTPEVIDAARRDLAVAITRIDAGDASTNPGAWCERCDYRAVCPSAAF